MHCGMTLGGGDTLGSGGRRGCCGSGVGMFEEGASSKMSHVGVASWKRLAREVGAGMYNIDAGNGGGDQRGALGASSCCSCLIQVHAKNCSYDLVLFLYQGGGAALRGRRSPRKPQCPAVL